MCPLCMTNVALVVAGATSSAGVLGYVAVKVRTLRRYRQLRQGTTENKERNVKQNNEREMVESVAIKTPSIVSAEEWEAARQQLLVKEKALTRARDALAAERRRMPW